MSDLPSRHAEGGWAAPVERLRVDWVPAGAVNLNVDGRALTGPLRGFGQLWQKTYRVYTGEFAPRDVMLAWRQNFEAFWPRGNRFYAPVEGISPGSVAVLNLGQARQGPPLISTGVFVIYADDESFSFLTPQGHMFAGMITFSAFVENEVSVAQVQAFLRASDPIYELGLRLRVGHIAEDRFWHAMLRNLAAHFHQRWPVEQRVVCLDPRVQWREARNVWLNAAIRTALHSVAAPVRWAARRLR